MGREKQRIRDSNKQGGKSYWDRLGKSENGKHDFCSNILLGVVQGEYAWLVCRAHSCDVIQACLPSVSQACVALQSWLVQRRVPRPVQESQTPHAILA